MGTTLLLLIWTGGLVWAALIGALGFLLVAAAIQAIKAAIFTARVLAATAFDPKTRTVRFACRMFRYAFMESPRWAQTVNDEFVFWPGYDEKTAGVTYPG